MGKINPACSSSLHPDNNHLKHFLQEVCFYTERLPFGFLPNLRKTINSHCLYEKTRRRVSNENSRVVFTFFITCFLTVLFDNLSYLILCLDHSLKQQCQNKSQQFVFNQIRLPLPEDDHPPMVASQ